MTPADHHDFGVLFILLPIIAVPLALEYGLWEGIGLNLTAWIFAIALFFIVWGLTRARSTNLHFGTLLLTIAFLLPMALANNGSYALSETSTVLGNTISVFGQAGIDFANLVFQQPIVAIFLLGLIILLFQNN